MKMPVHQSKLCFGVITDIHYAPDNAAATAADLARCLDYWQQRKVDFLLQLGDLVAGGEDAREKELPQILAVFRKFPGTIRHVLGNHCLAVPRNELLNTLGLQTPWYSWSTRGFRFVVLDGMDVSVLREPETPEDARILLMFREHPELHDYCGAIGSKQQQWLANELATAEMAGEKVIALCHFPLLPETTDPNHGLLWNHEEIAATLSSSPAVKVCLSGHYHDGSYALHKKRHFLILPAFAKRNEHPDAFCATAELSGERMVIYNQPGDIVHNLLLY